MKLDSLTKGSIIMMFVKEYPMPESVKNAVERMRKWADNEEDLLVGRAHAAYRKYQDYVKSAEKLLFEGTEGSFLYRFYVLLCYEVDVSPYAALLDDLRGCLVFTLDKEGKVVPNWSTINISGDALEAATTLCKWVDARSKKAREAADLLDHIHTDTTLKKKAPWLVPYYERYMEKNIAFVKEVKK